MLNVLKIELKKSMNKYFVFTMFVGLILVAMSMWTILRMHSETLAMYGENNSIISSLTVFNSWIGGEFCSLGNSIFFFVFPILITIPYGWSYCSEKVSGYNRMIIVRVGKVKYYLAKYIAVFVSGGLAMIIPMITSFYLIHLFVPSLKPLVEFDIYYGVSANSFMSDLYYTFPYVYVGIYIFIDFIFAGILACISMAAAVFIKKKWIVAVVPFLLCMAIAFSTKFIYAGEIIKKEISPMVFLRPSNAGYPASLLVMVIMAAVLVLIAMMCFIWERHNDIY